MRRSLAGSILLIDYFPGWQPQKQRPSLVLSVVQGNLCWVAPITSDQTGEVTHDFRLPIVQSVCPGAFSDSGGLLSCNCVADLSWRLIAAVSRTALIIDGEERAITVHAVQQLSRDDLAALAAHCPKPARALLGW